MTRTDESVIVLASMRALEYREAAWEAHDRHVAPPDPSPLSDRALYAIRQYEVSDLPSDAREAIEAEWKRRGLSPDLVEQIMTFVVLALLGVSGVLIGWMLLAP